MPNIISLPLLVLSAVRITCLFLCGTTSGWIPLCVFPLTSRAKYSVFLRFQAFSREEISILE